MYPKSKIWLTQSHCQESYSKKNIIVLMPQAIELSKRKQFSPS